MKKTLFCILALLFQNFLSAQSVIKAEKSPALTLEEKEILTGTFTSYDVISLESSKLKKDLRQKNKDFKCEIPSDLLSNSTFKVEENEIRTTDFQSVISNGKIRKKEDKKNECDTYQGYINGIEEQWLRLYADDNMIMGCFISKKKEMCLWSHFLT